MFTQFDPNNCDVNQLCQYGLLSLVCKCNGTIVISKYLAVIPCDLLHFVLMISVPSQKSRCFAVVS